jgi:hypothetical protein
MKGSDMRRIAFALALLPALLLLTSSAQGQQSTSFRLTEYTINAGGHPDEGLIMASTRFRVTLDAIGGGVEGARLSSTGFRLDGGFQYCFPPPGEVAGLQFTDQQTLVWNSEKSIGSYNLYRGEVNSLPGLAYGDCLQSGIQVTTTIDTSAPASGEAYFYLPTAENLLMEEGSKGFASDDSQRGNPAPCP